MTLYETINANESLFARAVLCFQDGDLPGAEALLRDLIDRKADDPEVYHLLGLMSLKMQEKESAREYFARAAEGAPEDAKYCYNYGTVLQDLGELQEARDLLKKSYESFYKTFGPGHPNTKIVKNNLESLKTAQ